MVKSESEIKKMTKAQLKQWLMKHDQRLPAMEKLKPYYLERAIKYFNHLQNNNNTVANRPISKKKKPIISNARTKKKHAYSISNTPKKSIPNSPSLSRSKKRIHRIVRKTPTKQSPSMTRSLKKKRQRMRRATTDSYDSENNNNNIENTGDHNNNINIDKMTISNLQTWLDDNNIDFVNGQKKKIYVDLVKKNMNKKRHLSPKHKKYTSPKPKKTKPNKYASPSARAPMPPNIRKSPLTPPKNGKNSLLSTPALNRTGVSRIDTPTKSTMRDEIRNLLELDGDPDGPFYPVKNDNTNLSDDGITPGGPSNFDEHVLHDVLNDLRREKESKPEPQPQPQPRPQRKHVKSKPKPRRKSMEPVMVYNPKIEENKNNIRRRNSDTSFFNSIIAKFSPHKLTSPSSIQNEVHNALNTNKINKQEKKSYISTPQQFNKNNNEINNINNMNGNNTYYGDDEPMSPAITNNNNNNSKQKQEITNINENKPRIPCESPGIIPSIPSYINRNEKQNLSPMKLPFEMKGRKPLEKKSSSKCWTLLRVIFIILFGIGIAVAFAVFGVVDMINDNVNMNMNMNPLAFGNQLLEQFSEYINNISAEEQIYFCDTGTNSIKGSEISKCEICPTDASFCKDGNAICKTNYILHDKKCVLDGIVVKFSYELKTQISKILSEKKGKYECGDNDITEYTMNEDELLSNLIIFDDSKKKESFEYFKKNILPDSSTLKINNNGQYFSYKSVKPPICRIQEWIRNNTFGIISIIVVALVAFGIAYKCHRKNYIQKQIECMVDNVYIILDEFEKCNDQPFVPRDVIKQRIKPQTNALWDGVVAEIKKKGNIKLSWRMIDGVQRKCWALITVHNNNNNNNNNNNGMGNNNWSPGQQQQQQQWNFNVNKNNNNGFNFTRSNQMVQSMDNDESEPTSFPPHSKRW